LQRGGITKGSGMVGTKRRTQKNYHERKMGVKLDADRKKREERIEGPRARKAAGEMEIEKTWKAEWGGEFQRRQLKAEKGWRGSKGK